MPSKNPTTVVLTKIAQEVKDDLAPVFGLKNILSAGLMLFGKLSDTDQKRAISETNGDNAEPLVICSQKTREEHQKDLDEIGRRLFQAVIKREKRQKQRRRPPGAKSG